MKTAAATIETWADTLAARIARTGPVRVISYADVRALQTGRFVRVGETPTGWGRTDSLWTVKQ